MPKVTPSVTSYFSCLTCRASRARRVEPCCSTSLTQPECMDSTRRMCPVVSTCDVTSQVEFGLMMRLSSSMFVN